MKFCKGSGTGENEKMKKKQKQLTDNLILKYGNVNRQKNKYHLGVNLKIKSIASSYVRQLSQLPMKTLSQTTLTFMEVENGIIDQLSVHEQIKRLMEQIGQIYQQNQQNIDILIEGVGKNILNPPQVKFIFKVFIQYLDTISPLINQNYHLICVWLNWLNLSIPQMDQCIQEVIDGRMKEQHWGKQNLISFLEMSIPNMIDQANFMTVVRRQQ